MSETRTTDSDNYERETRIRDAYAKKLETERPGEVLLSTEHAYLTVDDRLLRGDMKTMDQQDVLRIWEFKIEGDYSGLGQILTYLALARKAYEFTRTMCGVLAAFNFRPEIEEAIAVLNLGIEIVQIPSKYKQAGGLLPGGMSVVPPAIPTAHSDPED